MIEPEKLYQMLHGGTFRPFRVYMKDGRQFDVVNKHAAVVGRTYFSISQPLPDQRDKEWPICETTDDVDLLDIERLEMLNENPTRTSKSERNDNGASGDRLVIEPGKLYQMLHGGSFQPFRVHMKDGRKFDVVNKHATIVGRTYLTIGRPLPGHRDKEWPICERFDDVDLVDIERLEMLDGV